VGIKGLVNWNKKGLEDGEITLSLQDLSAITSGVTVSGLNSTLKLLGPTFMQTVPRQKITIKKIIAGVDIEDLKTEFHIKSREKGHLESVTFSLLDALISVDPGEWQTDPPTGKTTVRLSGLNLQKVSGLIPVEGVEVVGRLSGTLPVALYEKGVVIDAGVLQTEGPGTIRLSGEFVKRMAKESGLPEIVIEALQNYHYQKLSLTVDRDIEGEYAIVLKAVGNNPDLDGGRPVELNLNLSGKLDKFLILKEQMDRLDKIFSDPLN
jgi:hypothetical protein